MTGEISFIPGVLARGSASYSRATFSLEYFHDAEVSEASTALERSLGINRTNWLISIDTLVLVFSFKDGGLQSFDAYSNMQRWDSLRSIELPHVTGTGNIALLNEPEPNPLPLPGTVRYFYSAFERRLLIALGEIDASNSVYYSISDRLVAGITEGHLSRLYVSGLEVT
jgi:hypothetical protein